MTLPVVQPARADKPNAARRRQACVSAAWADPPIVRRERRRAICSWTAGYGTLTEDCRGEEGKGEYPVKKGKVAEHAGLLESRANRLQVPLHFTHAPPSRGATASSRISAAMPGGIKSLLSSGGRRRSGTPGDGSQSPLVKKTAPIPTIEVVSVHRASPPEIVRPAASLASLRKCETVVALTEYLRSSSSTSSIDPLRPTNRLRVSPLPSRSRLCSRCSSLLTLASSSRYSLNSSTGGFVPVLEGPVLCKLCLNEVSGDKVTRLGECGCAFCTECMKAYIEFEIGEGAYDLSCPDAQCPSQGVLQLEEIKRLVGSDLLEKHKRYRLNREVELDKTRTWCPRAGCETVCSMCPQQRCHPQSVFCPTCTASFCSNCKLEWHEGATCEDLARRLEKEGRDEPGIPFDSDLIKCCPMCNVPIEKDEGCAQMMCKRCKHVFCWYCLASLDDDFLLRHYDKGPCKNKLGHSRASVIWHRTQVIGIFAGFGILLLVASPLLLLAAPCIVCCKCRFCNTGTTKLDNEDEGPGNEGS